MNTDERFNYYCEQMLKHAGEKAAKRLETAMSEMLEMKCTPIKIWTYAKRELDAAIRANTPPLSREDIDARNRSIPGYKG